MCTFLFVCFWVLHVYFPSVIRAEETKAGKNDPIDCPVSQYIEHCLDLMTEGGTMLEAKTKPWGASQEECPLRPLLLFLP